MQRSAAGLSTPVKAEAGGTDAKVGGKFGEMHGYGFIKMLSGASDSKELTQVKDGDKFNATMPPPKKKKLF